VSRGESLYQGLCRARSLDAAVARMGREDLAEVAVYLSGIKPTGGVPAQIMGMVSARLGETEPKKRRATK
jgi:hypothetical protein